MWPFKKHPPINDLNDDEDLWSVMQASTADGPMLVRINSTAKRWSKHPSLGIRVGFAIPFKHPNSDEGSFSFENAALNQMEVKILLSQVGWSGYSCTYDNNRYFQRSRFLCSKRWDDRKYS